MRYSLPFKNCVFKDYPNGSVSQWFGENPELYCKAIKYPDGSCLIAHNGLDLLAPYGTSLFALSDQKVVETRDKEDGYGKHIKCINSELGYEFTYGHLSKISVVLGQSLKSGEKLGELGNSGFVISGPTPYWRFNPYAGSHEHITIRKFESYINGSYNIQYQSKDKGTILDYTNGFKGAIDPMILFPETENEEAQIITLQLTVISLANQVISLLKQLLGRI